jgi:hypothetical protein
MLRYGATILSILLPSAAFAQAPVSLHASYDTYAAGLHVAKVEMGISFGPWSYQMGLRYYTTGMAGLFLHGHQYDVVSGSWQGLRAKPTRFVGEGLWHGMDRLAEIDYQGGKPVIRQLIPPNDFERESVPGGLQTNTVDTLSALAELVRVVEATGRCETAVRTYDGRRAVDIEAHTAREEVLEPTDRSSFAGRALRCDFSGRMLAGFLFGEDREHESRPMRGSAWLGAITASGPRLPVRMTFQTRWFGDATMYLTEVGSGMKVARGE